MSNVNIGAEALSEFCAGNGQVGQTEDKVYPVGIPIRKHIVIRAHADIGEGETITVGPTGRAADGFILAAGEQTPPIYVDNTDKIGVIGSNDNLGFSFILS